MVGVVVLAYAAIEARSVALAGFGLDSLIEIGASTVVLWELAEVGHERQQRAMRIIGVAFVGLAVYLGIQSSVVLVVGFHPRHGVLGISWTAVTAVVMFGLAFGKAKTGAALSNPVLRAEGRITMIDGLLATAVLVGRPTPQRVTCSCTTPSERHEPHGTRNGTLRDSGCSGFAVQYFGSIKVRALGVPQ